MGKKRKTQSEDTPEQSTPFNAAFAGLGSLREGLPSAPLEGVASPPSREAAPPQSSNSVALVLQREKKGRAGKTATRVRGLATPEERQRWARILKKELGCGATIDGEDLILLGDVGARAKERLEAAGFRRVVLGN